MKAKFIKGIASVAFCCALLTSCEEKFVEYNTNQYQATDEQLEADDALLKAYFAQLQRSVITFADGKYLDSDYQIAYNLCADTWASYMAPTIASNNGRHNGAYAIIDGWSRAMFVQKYEYAMAAWRPLHKKALEAGRDHIAAIGDVLKVAAMHQVTDYYGPIPYSQVGTTVTPEYDSQEEVYEQFFEELDNAIDVMTDFALANPGALVLPAQDYVYGGDIYGWIRFANSLRLRLAMRVSYANPDLAQAEAQKSLTHSVGVITNNSQNAKLADAIVPHHPIQIINVEFNDADCTTNASLACYLQGMNDGRKFIYTKQRTYNRTTTTCYGVRNGIQTSNWNTYKNANGRYSTPNAGIYKIVWMNAAEVYFLRAEAALRGWSSDNARSMYEAGISASFQEWGATGDATYIASSGKMGNNTDGASQTANNINAVSTITVAWDDAADFETKLERIHTQKWLGLFPNSAEAWAEYRRTGYPKLFPVVSNQSDGVVDTDLQIRRVPYPISEQSENPVGYATGVAALNGADNAGTKLWWDQKPR